MKLLIALIFLTPLISNSQSGATNGRAVVFSTPNSTALNFGNISANFTLNGKKRLEYRIQLNDEQTAVLLRREQGNWIAQDTIISDSGLWELRSGGLLVSPFKIFDFNKDGNEDLVCLLTLSGHSDEATAIFLNNPLTERLIKLHDVAGEQDEFINPEFDEQKRVLKTFISGGLYGVTTASFYRLKNGKAIPIERIETDNTNTSQTIKRVYIGKGGKWIQKNEYQKKRDNP